MTTQLIISVIGFLTGAISIGLHAWTYFTDLAKNRSGADAQTARDISTARGAETRMALAEANAPKSDADVDARLKAGTL